MTTTVRGVVDRVVTLHQGEGTTALLMFAYSFLAMSAYNVVKPVTQSQVISDLGADQVPWILLGASVVIGFVMQAYGRLARQVPTRWLIPSVQAGEVLLLVLFWFLFMTDAVWVSVAFFLLGLMLGVLLISQFWTLANQIYDPRQAKRIFGFIGGGASLGGLTGSAITRFTASLVGDHNLLLVGAALLALCIGIVARIVRRHEPGVAAPAAERDVSGGEAIQLLARSRHLQVIALVIGASAIGAAIVGQQVFMVAETRDEGAMTAFLAEINVYLSLLGLVIQVGLTSRIHRHLGLGIALLLLPMGLGATAALILATGAVGAVVAAKVADGSLRYTLDKTSREVLFLPLPADIKSRAKPFVDVVVDRTAKAGGAMLLLVLVQPWGLDLAWWQLSYASLGLVGLWIVAALLARREYLRSFRRSFSDRAIAPAAVQLDVADASTLETLVEELASPDEGAVLYAIELLETFGKRNLVTPLLLHHQSEKVRRRALVSLEHASPEARARWAPLVERMLKDDDPDVRAAAVHAMALFGMETAAATMRRYLDDEDPRVACTAATVLADSDSASDVQLARKLFTQLMADARPSAAPARREVAVALGRVRRPELRRMLASLVLDPDLDVAREAVRSARTGSRCDPVLVPALASLLSHRVLKRDAREALIGYGPPVIDVLAFLLHDPDEHRWVRRHIPATLARLPHQTAMDALVAALDDPDGFVRYKALEAVEHLHRSHPTLDFDLGKIEALAARETTRFYTGLTLRHDLVRHRPDARRCLLVRALDDKMARARDRVFRLLGLRYGWEDVAAARHTLEHRDGAPPAAAVEYLDTLIGVGLRRRVIPMLDEAPEDRKARHAHTMLKTHPRDLDDVLSLLIHDDDPVVSATAVYLAADVGLESLWPDVEFVAAHGSGERDAVEAARWALDRRGSAAAPRTTAWLPSVAVADRLRAVPLFSFVSVDELFRVARAGRQVACEAGRLLYQAGTAPDHVRFLLEGTVSTGDGHAAPDRAAPAALAVESVLEGRPVDRTLRTTRDALCLEIESSLFLSMLAESTPLAQGVFRTLLARSGSRLREALGTLPTGDGQRRREPPLQPIDQVFLLRRHPLFERATVEQLLALTSVLHELSLPAGATLFNGNEPPGLCHVVRGQVQLERDGSQPVVVGEGQTLGAVEVLTGVDDGWKARVVAPVYALHVTAADLFRLLADHVDLMQSLIGGALLAVNRPGNTST